MKNRIKKIRKEFDLTQQKFADRLGISRGNIGAYEVGKNAPSDSVIALICREFNINEEWLRTGRGDMRSSAPSTSLDSLAEDYNLTRGEYILIEKFLKLKPEIRQAFIDYAMDVASAMNNNDIPDEALTESSESKDSKPTYEGMTVEEAEEAYIKSRLNAVKNKTSSASTTTEETDEIESNIVV